MYVGVLPECLSVQGSRIPWNWSQRQLCTAMWVLGMEPGYFGNEASARNL